MANAPTYLNHSGQAEDAQGVVVVQEDGTFLDWTTIGGGGGGGDASAANQTTEIARLDSILAKIIAAPATEAKQDDLLAEVQAGNLDMVAHDAAAAAVNPLLIGGYASAAQPTDVSATTDAVRAWLTLYGAQVAEISGGVIAHDAADSGAPVKIGGKALAALSALTLPASADRVNASFDLDGAIIVRVGGAVGDRISARATNTDGAVGDCIAAQASGIAVNLTDVTLTNSHATQFCSVDILDGATIKWTFPVPPLGGVCHRFETPLKGTAATAWRFDPSAATTTVTCCMSGRLTKL